MEQAERILALTILAGVGGGLAGGLAASALGKSHLLRSCTRPALLASLFTASTLTTACSLQHTGVGEAGSLGVGAGWTALYFGRFLVGTRTGGWRAWVGAVPASVGTGLLAMALSSIATSSITPSSTSPIPSLPLSVSLSMPSPLGWVRQRWERIAALEARLHDLNAELQASTK